MRPEGLPAEAVRERVGRAMALDVGWDRVLNSICTEPHPLGVELGALAAHTNLGDPRIFRGTARIERAVVDLLLDLVAGEGGSGSLVSGGTEANLLAMLVARQRARAAAEAAGRTLEAPEVIVGSTVHFSFDKIVAALGLVPVRVPVDELLRLPPAGVEAAVGPQTVAIVATAGSSELGVVDPVEEIAAIARRHDVHLHVDAATGGFIIPFARELGRALPNFDFSLEGVSSITIDPHKYGLVTVPAGAVLFRAGIDHASFRVPSFFVDTPVHTNTFLGTRPGSAAVATYAVLEHLGRDGFLEVTRRNYETTDHLVARLREAGYRLLLEPQLNIVVFAVPGAVEVSRRLEEAGWIVSTSTRFTDTIRVVVTRHVTPAVVDAFLPALLRAVPAPPARPAPEASGAPRPVEEARR